MNQIPGIDRRLESMLLKQEAVDYVRHLAWLLDNFEMGLFVEEFCDDGVYQLIPRDNLEMGKPVCIIDDNKKRLRYRQKVVEKHWHYEKFRELRTLSPVLVELRDERSARVVTSYVIYQTDREGRTHFHVGGTFEDELVRIEDRWRIRARRAILDTFLPTYAIVLPP